MEVTSNILPSYILDKLTPSQIDGVSAEDEKLHRVYGCELTMQSGTILKLPQVVMVTGQNILNRFYYRKSLKRFDVFSIAMGSLLLASKVEESFKTLREILFAFHHLYAKRKGLQLKPMELGGQQYTSWKNELIMIERYILKELGFSLYNIMDHPHKYILYFIKVLNGNEALANEAWSYLNDSMRLDVSLKFEAQTIACAAIYLAARKVDFPLPEDASGVWWEVFGAKTEDMDTICSEIIGLYQFNKLQWLEPLAEVEYLSPETCAAFDKELLISMEEPLLTSGLPVSGEPGGPSISNVQPFRGGASSEPATDGDSTPIGDGSFTPTSSSPPRGASDKSGEGGKKLERKWFSVVGDIDKLDEVGDGNGKNLAVEARADSQSASRGRESAPVPQEERRGYERSDRHRDRADSRDRRVDDRDADRDRDRRDRRPAEREVSSSSRVEARTSSRQRSRSPPRDRERERDRDRASRYDCGRRSPSRGVESSHRNRRASPERGQASRRSDRDARSPRRRDEDSARGSNYYSDARKNRSNSRSPKRRRA